MIGTKEVTVLQGKNGLSNSDAGEAASILNNDHSPIRAIVQVF
jgi:hypothetical protein